MWCAIASVDGVSFSIGEPVYIVERGRSGCETWRALSRVRPVHGARQIQARGAAVRFDNDEVRSILGAQLHDSIRG
jgi:hypothetical protein